MFKTKCTKTGRENRNQALRETELDAVVGGRGEIVVVGCTTPRPMGGYPPGTAVWNPWINPRPPIQF